MDAKWIAREKARLKTQAKIEFEAIASQIQNCSILTEKDKSDLMSLLEVGASGPYHSFESPAILKVIENHVDDEDKIDILDVCTAVQSIDTSEYMSLMYKINGDLDQYLDSEPVQFDGDILITDPCYIMRAEHHGTQPIAEDDWNACDYGSHN